MYRREALATAAGVAGAVAGCLGPVEVDTDRPTGEIDVTFRTEANRSYQLALTLEDADGRVVDELDSEFPPDHTPGPSFFGAGLANGPYTVVVGTEVDEERFRWVVEDCPRLDVAVTVADDGTLAVERTCSPTRTAGRGTDPGGRG